MVNNQSIFMENFILNQTDFNNYLKKNKFEYILLKPILNSYQAKYFLNAFENSKIIWAFRNYNEVVHSSLSKFGDRVALSLKDYILIGKGDGWITKFISDEELITLKDLSKGKLSIEDWMALVWWSVNHIVFYQKLYLNERFLLLDYSDVLSYPKETLQVLYEFTSINIRNIDKYIKTEVHRLKLALLQ